MGNSKGSAGWLLPVPGFSTLVTRPDGVFVASAGGPVTSEGAGICASGVWAEDAATANANRATEKRIRIRLLYGVIPNSVPQVRVRLLDANLGRGRFGMQEPNLDFPVSSFAIQVSSFRTQFRVSSFKFPVQIQLLS